MKLSTTHTSGRETPTSRRAMPSRTATTRPNRLVTNQYLRIPTAKSSSDPVKLGCNLLVMANRLAIVGRSATKKARQMSITVTVPVALEA